MTTRRKVIFINIIIFIVGLFACEIYLRIFCPGLQGTFTGEIEPHPLYNHTLRPYHVEVFEYQGYTVDRKFNSMGLAHRSEIMVPKPANTYRVLFVGDSFVQGLDRESSLSAVVQNTLPDQTTQGKKIEIINCGQSSYSPLLHIARFKHQLVQLQADAIVLFPDLTDVYDDWVRYKPYAVYDEKKHLVKVLPSAYGTNFNETLDRYGYYRINSFLYRLFLLKFALTSVENKRHEDSGESVFDHASSSEELLSSHHKDMIRFSVQNIAEYIELVRSYGIHISIAVYPHLPQITGTYNRVYERKIQNLCAREQVPFKSFFDEIARDVRAGDTLYFKNDMHFNPTGYRRLGKYLAEWITAFPQESLGCSF